MRLNYSEAHSKITLALRKAPPEGSRHGRGFRLAVRDKAVYVYLGYARRGTHCFLL